VSLNPHLTHPPKPLKVSRKVDKCKALASGGVAGIVAEVNGAAGSVAGTKKEKAPVGPGK